MPNNQSNLVLLSGQVALAQAMDVVANNIANANTTGFKREGIAFNTYLKHDDRPGATNKKPTQFVYDRGTYRDTSAGPIVNTGNPLDLAIQGKGFFQIQMADGTTAYTRAGAFQLDPQGQIETLSGQPVMGDGGNPIIIPVTASQVNISGDGFVTARVDEGTQLAQIGKIPLVKFDNEQDMQAQGNGLYTTKQEAQEDKDAVIKQGAIEQSNVQPVTEITDMIQIMRSYEMAANMISNENERQTSAVQRLEKTTGS